MSADPALEELHETVSRRLHASGLRYTPSRRAVVEALATEDRPLTIPDILRVDPSLAQSSTYRNLTELIAAGVAHRIVVGEDFSHFELAEDLTSHHHHLVCIDCGRVDDVTLDAQIEATLCQALDQVARLADFEAEHHRLDLLGRCAACA